MANLSKLKRDQMNEFLEHLKKQHKDDDKSLSAINEIQTKLTEKKYGLVWEEHTEQVDEEMKTKIPVFTIDSSKTINVSNSSDCNFLLEGDNLHSLTLLEKTHKGKIDVIYIDPPYNTGHSNFLYDDKIINSEDSFKHSKWLSFMKKRLFIAHNLLSKDGIIFISIDDNEYANLKLLCDEIFGEQNHVGTIIQNKCNAQNDALNLEKNHDYCLVFCKSRIFIRKNSTVKEKAHIYMHKFDNKKCIKEDDKFYYIGASITTGGEGGTLKARPNLGYTIYFNDSTGDFIAIDDYDHEKAKISDEELEIYNTNQSYIKRGYSVIRPPRKKGKLGVWTWDINKFNLEKDTILIKKTKSGYSVSKKIYVDSQFVKFNGDEYVYCKESNVPLKSIQEFSSSLGSSSLLNVLKKQDFNNPKNVEFIKMLISSFPNKNSIILDFFAGSGTTGQAVLELNKEDCGNRKFILCTNNENNICAKVTYPRLKTVITGLRLDNSKYSDGIKSNLLYYKTDFVPKESDELSQQLNEHIKEMIQLEIGKIISNKEYPIILTDDDADELESDISKYKDIKTIFIANDVMLTSKQKKLFDKYDIKTIPDNFFEFELREQGEIF